MDEVTDVDWGDVFVVDVSHVTSEGNGDEDTSSRLPQRVAEGACAPNGVWSTACRSLFPMELSGDVARNDVMW